MEKKFDMEIMKNPLVASLSRCEESVWINEEELRGSILTVQFSSVQLLSCIQLFVTT